jgi:hypothetical protein
MTARPASEVLEALIETQNKFAVLRAENKELLAENDRFIELLADADRMASENFMLRMMLSCALPIAEKHAQLGIDRRICAVIREHLEMPPLAGKPVLIVDNERGA